MAPIKPSVAKLVVSLYQLHSISFGKGKFVSASGGKVVYVKTRVS